MVSLQRRATIVAVFGTTTPAAGEPDALFQVPASRRREVLRLVIAGWTDRTVWNRPGVRLSVEGLVGKGLLDDAGSDLVVSADVRFSLRLDEAPSSE